MQLANFELDDNPRFGEVKGDSITPITQGLDDLLRRASEPSVTGLELEPRSFPLGEVRLLAPILRPGKIVCVGRNYAEHARERGSVIPT